MFILGNGYQIWILFEYQLVGRQNPQFIESILAVNRTVKGSFSYCHLRLHLHRSPGECIKDQFTLSESEREYFL